MSTTTTHPEFNEGTEALEVAGAFPDSVRGKTVLITGVNPKGIGFTTAEAFASQSPSHLIVAGRSLDKLQESIDTFKAKYPTVSYRALRLNLISQKDVRSAATELLSWTDVPAINIVVNSAGIALQPERKLSEDGIEVCFATNHIGHFLFTSLIMPKLIKAAESSPKGATRIINVSSLSPCWGGMRWSDINFEKVNKDLPQEEQPNYDILRFWNYVDPENLGWTSLEPYNQSKVANVLFSIGATRRLYEKHGILSLAVHPGVIDTELKRDAPPQMDGIVDKMKITLKTLGGGAATSLLAALDPKLGPFETKNGKENWGVYFIDCQLSDRCSARAESSAEAEKLWMLSEDLVKQKFAW